MTRNQLRVMLALPVVLTIVGIIGIEGTPASWPQQSRQYFEWYLSQPLGQSAHLLTNAANLGLVILGAATIGLMVFWPPARYAYVVGLMLTFAGDMSGVPYLSGGWPKVIESIAQVLIGANIALIFTPPGAQLFRGASIAG